LCPFASFAEQKKYRYILNIFNTYVESFPRICEFLNIKSLYILSYFTASRCVRTHFDIIGRIRYNVSDCHRDAFCIRVSTNITLILLSSLNLANLYLWVKNKWQMVSIFYSNLNDAYYEHVYPYMVPIMLPIAQIAMTASVYMTVVTCFDRYCYSKSIIYIVFCFT